MEAVQRAGMIAVVVVGVTGILVMEETRMSRGKVRVTRGGGVAPGGVPVRDT